MKALVGAFNQEKALVGAFSVIVQTVVEPMEHYTALIVYLARYLAICRPLSPLARSSMGEAKKIILLIWAISFLSALPWALFTKVTFD